MSACRFTFARRRKIYRDEEEEERNYRDAEDKKDFYKIFLITFIPVRKNLMNLQTKIYLGAGVAIVLIVLTMSVSMWMTNHRITQAERAASAAKQAAAEKEKLAAEKETEAAAYKEKTEYLEKQVAEIEATARKQDEEIERTKSNSAAARSRVDRARGVRSVDTTADELCRKLAELEHPCD